MTEARKPLDGKAYGHIQPSHTPGPWTHDASDDDEEVYGRPVNASGGFTIAAVGDRCDATLISAAPDLLAACEKALLYITREDVREIIEAAVEKAQGRR